MSELRHNLSAPRRKYGRPRAGVGANLGTMKNEHANPNAELQRSFEPLRVIFALSALLLGLLASLHF
jgi:hypothetical protein